jgi:hypothetical protein
LLKATTRDGAKIKGRHGIPATPFQRILASGILIVQQQWQLTAPATTRSTRAPLRREIAACQQRLLHLTRTKTG